MLDTGLSKQLELRGQSFGRVKCNVRQGVGSNPALTNLFYLGASTFLSDIFLYTWHVWPEALSPVVNLLSQSVVMLSISSLKMPD